MKFGIGDEVIFEDPDHPDHGDMGKIVEVDTTSCLAVWKSSGTLQSCSLELIRHATPLDKILE